MSRVLGVAFGPDAAVFSLGQHTGVPYFREVSTRERTSAKPAFDLAPLAGSGLYLSASGSIVRPAEDRQGRTRGRGAVDRAMRTDCREFQLIPALQARPSSIDVPFAEAPDTSSDLLSRQGSGGSPSGNAVPHRGAGEDPVHRLSPGEGED